ncbi:MAG: hypothetical protein WDO13_17225 [Verrucomicrobiota bacterium]
MLSGVAVAGLSSIARADDAASGTLTSEALGNGDFDYTIKLTNTGTNNLETFWFSWTPAGDFMPVSPTSVVSPTDWTANITNLAPATASPSSG